MYIFSGNEILGEWMAAYHLRDDFILICSSIWMLHSSYLSWYIFWYIIQLTLFGWRMERKFDVQFSISFFQWHLSQCMSTKKEKCFRSWCFNAHRTLKTFSNIQREYMRQSVWRIYDTCTKRIRKVHSKCTLKCLSFNSWYHLIRLHSFLSVGFSWVIH